MPFCCGEKNGGQAFFQTKRVQQVPCLLLIVLYIVLCSDVYTSAPERSWGLNDRRTKAAQDRSVDLRKPVLDSRHFFFLPLFMSAIAGLSSLCSHLDQFSKPDVVREKNDFACDWLIFRRRSIAKLRTSRKKCAANACNLLAGATALSPLTAIFDRKKSTLIP